MMEETLRGARPDLGRVEASSGCSTAGGPPYRASPGQLAEHLELSSGAMTNRLDRLEEAG